MLIIDTEIYSDYFLVSALNIETGKITHIEAFDGQPIDKARLHKLMKRVTMSFNGNHFDLPLLAAALNDYSVAQIKKLADTIIKSNESIWRVLKAYELRVPDSWDHIDLIEVAPGQSSLKIYGGRLNAPKMQDLPIEPDANISPEQRQIVREYCENDLHTTHLLYKALKPQIDLRVDMGAQYGMDFRSLSDAQIAEKLITHELKKLTGKDYRKPEIKDGYTFRYRDPNIIKFLSPYLTGVFKRIMVENWQLGPNGSVQMPMWLKESRIQIGQAEYQMGIGGLHSCEQRQCVKTDGGMVLADYDVASYYPSIIMQQQLAPNAFGKPFLTLYQSLIRRRLAAKRSGDKVTADTLKITLNGSFGKFGSKYSTLYAPELLIQTTITGQLALLMLIERLEAAGVRVVSANTDGIVVYHSETQFDAVDEITFDWMLDTSYQLERTLPSCMTVTRTDPALG
jgi:DNA polymerase elongation subunit (family B)